MKNCTYIHKNPAGKVFYVGAGSYHRMMMKAGRSAEWQEMAKHGRTVEVVAQWATQEEAFEHEKLLIACFKDMGHPLVNKALGGRGSMGYRWNHTDQARANMSKSKMGNQVWLGRKHKESTKQLQSQVAKGVAKPKLECHLCGKLIGGHSNLLQHQRKHELKI